VEKPAAEGLFCSNEFPCGWKISRKLADFQSGRLLYSIAPMEDAELLQEYVERRTEAAFTALVARHLDLVYSTARRMVGDAHLAQDVAQTVFIGLARSPARVRQPAALAGWLYATTRNTAAQVVRTEQRRQQRETEAMNRQLLDDNSPAAWEAVAPLLDEAMRELKPIEADAVVLRFFEGKSLRDTGQALDLSENAAQKRVERALEKIRDHFARRGVTASAALLGATIAANSVQAAPAGLAAGVAQTSLTGAAGAGGIFHFFWKAFFMSTMNKIVITLVLAAALAAIPVAIQQHKINQLEAQHPPARGVPAKKSGNAATDNLAMLKSILAMQDPLQMMRALTDFVSGLDAAGIRPLLDYLVKLPGTTHGTGLGGYAMMLMMERGMGGPSASNNELALSVLIDRLTHLNPHSALGWAAAVPNRYGRSELIGMVFASWASFDSTGALGAAGQIADLRLRETVIGEVAQSMIASNPAAALAALQGLPMNSAYRSIVSEVFTNWASQDPEAAIAAAMNLPANRDRNAAVLSAIQGWSLVDPQAALAYAGTLPNGATRTQAMNAAISALTEQDPQQAASYVATISNVPDRNRMTVQLAATWAEDDPQAAGDWVVQNTSANTLKQALTAVIDSMSLTDPLMASSYLEKMPNGGGFRETSLKEISNNWAEVDPPATMAWLVGFENPNGTTPVSAFRAGVETGVVKTWAASDPDAATAYVESLGVNNPQFASMMAAVATSRAAADPTAAAAWVQTLPDDGTRAAALSTVLTQVTSVDPTQALVLVNEMPAGTAQDTAYGKVISAWSASDPVTAAQSLTNLPAGATLNSATQAVAENWIQSDPTAAAQWINTLPSGDQRDSAVGAVVSALSASDSPSAFTWAISLTGGPARRRALNSVIQVWGRTDPTAAAAAVQSSNIAAATRNELLNTIQKNAPP
jgi:RNA polymerase sigma factor (sigma-70 family)